MGNRDRGWHPYNRGKPVDPDMWYGSLLMKWIAHIHAHCGVTDLRHCRGKQAILSPHGMTSGVDCLDIS